MIERGRGPAARRMARGTIVIEIAGDVIGVCRAVVVRLVTVEAGAGRARVLPIDMALRAIHRRVRAREWKPGQVVIKRRGVPAVDRMAPGAVMTELASRVIWIACLRVIRRMAGIALARGVRVAVGVTSRTIGDRMTSGKWKRCRVCERDSGPFGRAYIVAIFAVG